MARVDLFYIPNPITHARFGMFVMPGMLYIPKPRQRILVAELRPWAWRQETAL